YKSSTINCTPWADAVNTYDSIHPTANFITSLTGTASNSLPQKLFDMTTSPAFPRPVSENRCANTCIGRTAGCHLIFVGSQAMVVEVPSILKRVEKIDRPGQIDHVTTQFVDLQAAQS